MTRRPAVTVIEALMAIFVMAIGLLALLTLFPLGAVSMWQALKDERVAESGINATAHFNAFQMGSDPMVAMTSGTASIFESPWPGSPTVPTLSGGSTPTYPVFVDPIGAGIGGLAYVVPTTGGGGGGGTFVTVGTAPPPTGVWSTMGGSVFGIPRTTLTSTYYTPTGTTGPAPGISVTSWQQRWFTLHDDLTFSDKGNGLPDPGLTGSLADSPIPREGRYSWAYMVRRAIAGTGPVPALGIGQRQSSLFDLTVVVYSSRVPGFDGSGNAVGEHLYGDPLSATPSGVVTWGATAAGTTPNGVTIDLTTAPAMAKPNLRRGSWILDARMTPTPQGFFYRVVSVTDVSPTVMELEVQRPLGGQLRTPIGPTATGPLIVMDNVVEVLEKLTNY
jgi:hypothetical protein